MTILAILTHFPTTEPTVSTVPPTRCKGKKSNKVTKRQSTKNAHGRLMRVARVLVKQLLYVIVFQKPYIAGGILEISAINNGTAFDRSTRPFRQTFQ